jgi:GT2 family glycosyltransferase
VVISVIIPSSAGGEREANLRALLQDLRAQSAAPAEVRVVRGVRPSGRARNEGARGARGQVLVFLDDDVRLGHEGVLEAMVRCLQTVPRAGMAGAAQLLPPHAGWFQKAAARQVPRSSSPVVRVPTDSDMVVTACCAVWRDLFWELGGFHEEVPRGVDPEFRHRLRKAGWRTVVAPEAWFYHPMPEGLLALCRTFFRNGRESAWTVRRFPELALENPDGHVAEFEPHRSQAYRAARHLLRLVEGILTLRWIGVAARLSYLAGYASGYVSSGGRKG